MFLMSVRPGKCVKKVVTAKEIIDIPYYFVTPLMKVGYVTTNVKRNSQNGLQNISFKKLKRIKERDELIPTDIC